MSLRRSAAALAGTALAGAVLAGACTGGDDTTTPTSVVEITTTTRPSRGNVDGVLTLGLWLPTSGPAAALAAPMIRGAELAVQDINNAGGVNGREVRLLERDEGADLATATASLEELLSDGRVDAVIGPVSSPTALALLDRLTSADVLTCSPSTSAIALSDRSTANRYFRTMPSDELQGAAMARAVAATGRRSAGIIFPDDAYGRRYAQSVTDELSRLAVSVVAAEPYDPSGADVPDAVERALGAEPAAVGVIGGADQGGAVLAELRANGAIPILAPTFVSDGMRRADLFEHVDPGRPASVEGVQGTAAAFEPSGANWFRTAYEQFTPGTSASYASYAYDCVNLVALAATSAGSDVPGEIAARMQDVSRLGTSCRNFEDCAPKLEQGLNIDLDGASGPIELTPEGDPTVGVFDLFAFDETGRESILRQLVVTAG